MERVDVICSKEDGSCPLYEVLITFIGNGTLSQSVLHTYERFCDLKAQVDKYPGFTADANVDFPRKLKRASFGISISKRQNDIRCEKLHKVKRFN